MSLLSILVIGFLLGMKHATEADHLAAVATLATRQSTLAQALRQGLAWGVGHTVTLVLVGSLVLTLGKALPASMGPVLECLVGAMLILLGLDVLRRVLRDAGTRRRGSSESNLIEAGAALPFAALRFVAKVDQRGVLRPAPVLDQPLPLRALAVGMMHGMAGSAALIVLSLQNVDSIPKGLAYIALFGLGSMSGMALLSVAMALPLRLSAAFPGSLHRAMTGFVGLASLALGIWAIWRTAFA